MREKEARTPSAEGTRAHAELPHAGTLGVSRTPAARLAGLDAAPMNGSRIAPEGPEGGTGEGPLDELSDKPR